MHLTQLLRSMYSDFRARDGAAISTDMFTHPVLPERAPDSMWSRSREGMSIAVLPWKRAVQFEHVVLIGQDLTARKCAPAPPAPTQARVCSPSLPPSPPPSPAPSLSLTFSLLPPPLPPSRFWTMLGNKMTGAATAVLTKRWFPVFLPHPPSQEVERLHAMSAVVRQIGRTLRPLWVAHLSSDLISDLGAGL